jgi:hypothetical protein
MSRSWKFWKRNQTEPSALPAAPAMQPLETWAPLSSSKELLGLQRIIGNQAVLELLAFRQNQAAAGAATAKTSHQSFWRKLRRS